LRGVLICDDRVAIRNVGVEMRRLVGADALHDRADSL
jgi:hypothetical protein